MHKFAPEQLRTDIVELVDTIQAEQSVLNIRSAAVSIAGRYPTVPVELDDVTTALLQEATIKRVPIVFSADE